MVQPRQDPGFGQVSLDILGQGDALRVGHLDGDSAVKVGIPREINPAEASLAEPVDHLVAADCHRVASGCPARRARVEQARLERLGRVGAPRPGSRSSHRQVWARVCLSSADARNSCPGLSSPEGSDDAQPPFGGRDAHSPVLSNRPVKSRRSPRSTPLPARLPAAARKRTPLRCQYKPRCRTH